MEQPKNKTQLREEERAAKRAEKSKIRAERAAAAQKAKEEKEAALAAKKAEKEAAASNKEKGREAREKAREERFKRIQEKIEEKAAKQQRDKDRNRLLNPEELEHRKGAMKVYYEKNKERLNQARLMRLHESNPNMRVNFNTIKKYGWTVNGKKVDDTEFHTDQAVKNIRGYKKPPLPMPVLKNDAKSYKGLWEWLLDPIVKGSDSHKSNTSMTFRILQGEAIQGKVRYGKKDPHTFEDIKDIVPLLNDYENVEKKITAFYDNPASQRAKFANLVWLFSSYQYLVSNLSQAAKTHYLSMIGQGGRLEEEIERRAIERTTDEKLAVYKWSDIMRRVEKYYGRKSEIWLYMNIYEDTHGRDDLGDVMIVSNNDNSDLPDRQNYLVLHDSQEPYKGKYHPYIFLTVYKTRRIGGMVRKDLTEDTIALIKQSLEENPRKYLFIKNNNPNMPFGKMGAYITALLRGAGIKMTSRQLRNAFISDHPMDQMTEQERAAFLKTSGHNANTARKYLRRQKQTITENTEAALARRDAAAAAEEADDADTNERQPAPKKRGRPAKKAAADPPQAMPPAPKKRGRPAKAAAAPPPPPPPPPPMPSIEEEEQGEEGGESGRIRKKTAKGQEYAKTQAAKPRKRKSKQK